jgi:membrane protein implicated in regulation of membrane protease activity
MYIVIAIGMSAFAVTRSVPMYVLGSWDARVQSGVWIALTAMFSYYTYLYHQARKEKQTEREIVYRELLLALTLCLVFLLFLPYILGYYGW